MLYRAVDPTTYPRRPHLEYFRSLPDPIAGLTVGTEAADLPDYHRLRAYSFYLAFLHAAALAVERIIGDTEEADGP